MKIGMLFIFNKQHMDACHASEECLKSQMTVILQKLGDF
jgi:hypothetical protein